MSQIVPAILEKTKADFLDRESRVVKLPGVERIQVDFADGVFVENTTLPVGEINALNPAFTWEAHLMLQGPQDFLDYEISGFKAIIIHYEAYPDAESLKAALGSIKAMGLKNGIALNPATPVSVLENFKAGVDEYLLLGVTPGYQGQEFIEDTYGRIAEVRKLIPHALIEVDGGVNLSNIHRVAKTGADLIIAGSSLVKQSNVLEAYEKLIAEINKS